MGAELLGTGLLWLALVILARLPWAIRTDDQRRHGGGRRA